MHTALYYWLVANLLSLRLFLSFTASQTNISFLRVFKINFRSIMCPLHDHWILVALWWFLFFDLWRWRLQTGSLPARPIQLWRKDINVYVRHLGSSEWNLSNFARWPLLWMNLATLLINCLYHMTIFNHLLHMQCYKDMASFFLFGAIMNINNTSSNPQIARDQFCCFVCCRYCRIFMCF